MPLISLLKKEADSLVAAVAGGVIILFFARHGGIGISPDSVIYSSAAENLYHHGRLVAFTQYPVVEFPPFYPFFLAFVMGLTQSAPLSFAPYLNALLFGSVIFLAGWTISRFRYASRLLKWAVLSCIILSPCLLEVYSMVWTETLFILLTLLFLITIRNYFLSYSLRTLVLAALIASLASVTRYAGVTLIATGGLLLLTDLRPPVRKKILPLLVFSSVACLLLVIAFLRNYLVSSTITGQREKSTTSFIQNVHDAGAVFGDWLPLLHGRVEGMRWLVFVIIGALAIQGILSFFRNRRIATYEGIVSTFCFVYIGFMLVMASISRFEQLDSRFFSPVFIPLVWLAANGLSSLCIQWGKPLKYVAGGITLILFLGFQYNQVALDNETWNAVKDIGIPGYTEDDWKNSPTVNFIEKDSLPFRAGYTIYSNAYDAVYFFTRRSGKFLPHKEFKSEVQDFLNDRHCYLVWFTDGDNPDLVEMDFILNVKKMKLVREFDDGEIYEYGE